MIRFFIILRNQINCVIAYWLGPTSDFTKNGEEMILKKLASEVSYFLDVGAHQGDWTKKLLEFNPNVQGKLFEPERICASGLKKSFKGSSKIQVHEKALSDREGKARFSVHHNQQCSSLIGDKSYDDCYEVEVSLIDKEWDINGPCIDFLKIDAEGFDHKVIKGTQNLLKNKRIRFLQFEYNSYWIKGSGFLWESLELLCDCGYAVFLIRPNGIMPVKYEVFGEYFRYSNYFAVREEDLPLIKDIIYKSF